MNILILGASLQPDAVYEDIESMLRNFGTIISSPLATKAFEGSDHERYVRSLSLLSEADLIVAECSVASTGLGFELGVASLQTKPMILLHKQDTIISGLILGALQTKPIITYNEIEELKEKIKQLLGN
jgi:nucleoside 2-deoxyribosyltransferase